MRVVREQDYTFVTNNRSDFLDLHCQEPLHAGVRVIVLNVVPLQQPVRISSFAELDFSGVIAFTFDRLSPEGAQSNFLELFK